MKQELEWYLHQIRDVKRFAELGKMSTNSMEREIFSKISSDIGDIIQAIHRDIRKCDEYKGEKS